MTKNIITCIFEIIVDGLNIIKKIVDKLVYVIQNLPCILNYYYNLLKFGLSLVVISYNLLGPNFEKINDYEIKFDNKLQIKKKNKVLAETKIELPKVDATGFFDLLKNLDKNPSCHESNKSKKRKKHHC